MRIIKRVNFGERWMTVDYGDGGCDCFKSGAFREAISRADLDERVFNKGAVGLRVHMAEAGHIEKFTDPESFEEWAGWDPMANRIEEP